MPKMFLMPMSDLYPFGDFEDSSVDPSLVFVQKSLHYYNADQQDLIRRTLASLKSLRHENLLLIDHVLEQEGVIHVFYQYAPMRLENWLLNVNEHIFDDLKNQVFNLIEYLRRNNVCFQFDPNYIGLSKDLKAKYFLMDFAIETEVTQVIVGKTKAQAAQFFALKAAQSHKVEEELSSPTLNFSKEADLTSKIESSKKRSLEVLTRFRKMNQK